MDLSNSYNYIYWFERAELSGKRASDVLVPEPWATMPSPAKPASQAWGCRPGSSPGTTGSASQIVSFLGFSPSAVVLKIAI